MLLPYLFFAESINYLYQLYLIWFYYLWQLLFVIYNAVIFHLFFKCIIIVEMWYIVFVKNKLFKYTRRILEVKNVAYKKFVVYNSTGWRPAELLLSTCVCLSICIKLYQTGFFSSFFSIWHPKWPPWQQFLSKVCPDYSGTKSERDIWGFCVAFFEKGHIGITFRRRRRPENGFRAIT